MTTPTTPTTPKGQSTMNTPAPVSIQQLQREIDQIRAKLNASSRRPLEPLQSSVNRWTARATIDPKLRGELHEAMRCLEAEEANHKTIGELELQLVGMQHQLDKARQQERMDLIQRTNKRLAKASDEYLRCGSQLIAAYRNLLEQQQRSRRVPGASDNIPDGFDFLPANPAGWVGKTSEMMVSGNLPFENAEADAA